MHVALMSKTFSHNDLTRFITDAHPPFTTNTPILQRINDSSQRETFV
jgi:hypothetical protein